MKVTKDKKKTMLTKAKPKVNTDQIIKIDEKILLLEQDIQNIKSGLKLALSRMGLHKEFKDGE